VIVRDFDVVDISLLPTETDPVLIVDSNAVLTAASSLQGLQTVPGRHSEFTEVANAIQL
jgi:hypothetical protein